jgi:hypothetical protein
VTIHFSLKLFVSEGKPNCEIAELLDIHPPAGVSPFQLEWKVPVMDVPVRVPEAVVPVPATFPAAAAVVDSSFFAHDPRSATVPTIKTIQNSKFFIITSFIVKKCRIIPTFIYRVWC